MRLVAAALMFGGLAPMPVSEAVARPPVVQRQIAWPACGWHVVDDTTSALLRRVYAVRESLRHVPSEVVAKRGLFWRQVDSPLLTELLPDARWFLVDVDYGEFGVPPCVAFALHGERIYARRELNALLSAEGLAANTTRRRDVVWLAVLSDCLVESANRASARPSLPLRRDAADFLPSSQRGASVTSRVALDEADSALSWERAQRSADSADAARARADSVAYYTAIPSIEFGELEPDEGTTSSSETVSVRIPCVIDGRARLFVLSFLQGELCELREKDREPVVYYRAESRH